MYQTVGILAGMGPWTSVDFLQKVIEATPATIDQDHIKIIMYHHPQIPSRIEAITNGGQSPLNELIKSARIIELAGADFIVMPCHTAHIWFHQLQKAVNIPFYSMVQHTVSATLADIKKTTPRILLLATDATVRVGMYQNAFAQHGVPITVPSTPEQRIVSAAIDDVKAGKIEHNRYLPQLQHLIQTYCPTHTCHVLGGCTEIPILFPYLPGKYEQLDPTRMLAKLTVAKAMEDRSYPYCNAREK